MFIKKLIIFLINILPFSQKNLFKFRLNWSIRSIILFIYNLYGKKIEFYFFLSGSDKFKNYKFVYRYLDLLLPRKNVKRVLEIGIGGHAQSYSGGQSLLGLKYIYSKAHIYGVDLIDKSFVQNKRITTLICDQGKTKNIINIFKKINKSFDLVIDDGSHFGVHQINSFKILFDYLNDGGVYIIEDLNGCFLKSYQGDPLYGVKKNTVAFFAKIVPSVYSKLLINKIRNSLGKFKEVSSILFIDNCIVVQKKKNYEKKFNKKDIYMSLNNLNKTQTRFKSRSGLILEKKTNNL